MAKEKKNTQPLLIPTKGGFWDAESVPTIVDKNDKGDQIQVRLVKKGDSVYVDVRNFYMKNETLNPGKGISIPVDLADEISLAITDLTQKL